MFIVTRGLKAWIIGLVLLVGVILVLLLIFQLFILLLPIIIILILLSYFFRMLNKLKKGKRKDFIEAKYTLKKE